MRRHEITDGQWEAIAPLLPGKTMDCGVTAKDNRLFFHAVVWIMRTGCPWADLPERFGLSNTVWKRFRRLALKGVWERIFQTLQVPELDWVMLGFSLQRDTVGELVLSHCWRNQSRESGPTRLG